MSFTNVHYAIDFKKSYQHIFSIKLELENALKHQELVLPAWTPGSYMIRDFAQHIIRVKAFEGESEVSVEKIHKSGFQVANTKRNIRVFYEVYGFDPSIRAAYIDNEQAFFNPTALFLRPVGLEDSGCKVTIGYFDNAQKKESKVATALKALDIDNNGFGSYFAHNFNELMDFPFQISTFKEVGFKVLDVPHKMVLVADVRDFNKERLSEDLTKLCSAYAKLFNNTLPFNHYVFIARFNEDSFGGLEHRSSSMLLCNPYSLPSHDMKEVDKNYQTLLSLCSHEYFHCWNVKRLKPKAFVPYDYDSENYTTMLWVFEGITAYYDDLMVKRAGLISTEMYLEILAKNITRYMRTQGRKVQSLAESSYDAWLKFYRQNENSPNVMISYYLKGALVALMLDVTIRKNSNNKKSLDDVMRKAYEKYGDERGIEESEFLKILAEYGINVATFKSDYIYGTKEIDFKTIFDVVGVDCSFQADESYISDDIAMNAFLGFKLKQMDLSCNEVSYVEVNSPAMNAGICPGDEIVALNDVRLCRKNYTSLLQSISPNKECKITYCRNMNMHSVVFEPAYNKLSKCILLRKEDADNEQNTLCSSWLSI